ncbi:hypothetical protein NE237_015363 [Protea cynaroides]|uniref:UspA domain-containing protein n=1 Tax=Protea cynaroides TaxID=273540 RepID=A0A9Q0KDV8_9MAGN|nr:hypothetical protein NE237_015363 [Protea cynaroides]
MITDDRPTPVAAAPTMVVCYLLSPARHTIRTLRFQREGNWASIMAAKTTTEKSVIVMGFDDSQHSFYTLNWTLDHFFAPFASNTPFKLVVVHAKPSPSTVVGLYGPGPGVDIVLPVVERNLMSVAARVVEKAKEICTSKSMNDVLVEIVDGDSRVVLCEAVEKHNASILVVGSHGHGAIKRAVLGSVSDYCTHHAHCSVMIVKMPKIKH